MNESLTGWELIADMYEWGSSTCEFNHF